MKYFLTLFIITILHLNSQLESSIPVDSSEYEVFEDQIEEEDSHPWPLYIFEEEHNSIQIRFPKSPTTSGNNGTISHSSVNTDAFPLVFHSLTYSAEEISVDPAELFEDYLDHFPKESFVVLNADVEVTEDEYHLDFFIVDIKHHIVREERIVVTEDNVYYLCTLYFLNTPGNHKAFISTFKIDDI